MLESTGVVRKIDDLGRVVIPKDIRKYLNIGVGDPIEIYINKSGQIVLKRYSPFSDFLKLSEKFTETLYKTTGYNCCITDKEKITAVSGNLSKDYLNSNISKHILNVMDNKKIWSTKNNGTNEILEKDKNINKYTSQIIAPIILDSNVVGTVILFSFEDKIITDLEYKLVESTANFLGSQI
jgi:AbrB family transcriptional regulator, stage V sporulation protein T